MVASRSCIRLYSVFLIMLSMTLFLSCSPKQNDKMGGQTEKSEQTESDFFSEMKANISNTSITVFPIIMTGRQFRNVAEVVAIMLEKADMKEISVPETGYLPAADHSFEQVTDSLVKFIRQHRIDTDYALYGEYIGTPETGIKAVRGVVFDRKGNIVWKDVQTEEDEAFKRVNPQNPMLCSYLLVERLRTDLGLPDPNREGATEGKWAAHWNKTSGIPPAEELAAMKIRRQAFNSVSSESTILVFQQMINDELQQGSQANLIKLLKDAGFSKARKCEKEILFKVEPDPNEQKRLWDVARQVRDYVKAEKLDADYFLYADYLIDVEKQAAHTVHFILCDQQGEWVIVDYQNSHKPDFKKLNPKNAGDCDRLLVKRLQEYIIHKW